MLKPENVQLRTQQHLMDAEGTDYEHPNIEEINDYVNGRGYICLDIDIWFDKMQGFWRWNCKIIKK